MEPVNQAALVAVRDCMGVKEGEKVLILTDEPTRRVGMALFEAAKLLGAQAYYVEMPTGMSHAEDPPEPVAEMLKLVDVALIPTKMSLSHTDARREASRRGVRIATLPGITEEVLARALKADYFTIAKRSRAVAKLLTKGSMVKVTTARGTDVTMSIENRKGYADTGLNHDKGSFSNLPAGEAYIAPVEGTTEGVIYFDGSMAGVGLLENETIRVGVKEGYATEITGGEGAKKMLAAMEPHGPLAFNVAELGIGTNSMARITGNVLEDEKAMGTVHIAFGDNKSMGGTVDVPSHLDGVILKPTLYVDDELVIDRGTLLVEG